MPETETKPDAEAPAETAPSGLYAKLLEAQRAAGSVSKSGRNDHHNYDYVKAEDVVRDGKAALNGAGLAVQIRVDEVETEAGRTSSGGASATATVTGALVVIDPDSGEQHETPLHGVGVDAPGDKAIYKAISGGTKYAYLAALQIAFGDDPEDSTTPGGKASYAARGPVELPVYAQPMTDDEIGTTRRALGYLLDTAGPADETTNAALKAITEACGGTLPKAVGHALYLAGKELGAMRRGEEPDPAPAEAGEEPQTAPEQADEAPPETAEQQPDPDSPAAAQNASAEVFDPAAGKFIPPDGETDIDF
jgi:hypothetical protein